jgi:hypothetical protein
MTIDTVKSYTNGITIEDTMLDAALALQLIGINTNNRPIKHRNVIRFAEDMINDRWAYTAEPIKIDRNGVLLDGQNRCYAVIRATEISERPIAIPVLIVRGLEPESQDKMDTGSTRSVGDQIARRGVSSYSLTAAAVRVICLYKNNGKSVTHAAMLDYFDANRATIDGCVSTVHDLANTSGVNTSVLIAAKYLLSDVVEDDGEIDTFINEMLTGIGLEDGSPVLALRNRAQVAKMRREFINNYVLLNMTLRVWNAWRKGETMKKFPVWGRATGNMKIAS